MASIQKKGDSYYCQFVYLGKRHTVTIGDVSEDEALDFAGSTGLLLRRIKQGLVRVPAAVAIGEFVVRGGTITEPGETPPEHVLFADFKNRYLDTHRNGAMEANSLDTVEMHLKHVERTLGPKFPLQSLTLADLQRHVSARAKKKYRGKQLSPVTLGKEMASFRAAWNWAALNGMVTGMFPSKGVVYPKADEKPPFQTWQDIKRKIRPTMSDAEQADLWNCLYLTLPEVEELLAFVKANAGYSWVYVMFCFAAHTGARRSEMLRVLVLDVDFDGMTVLLREKKRSRKQRTTRRVPLTPFLASVLREWLQEHPGGDYLLCHDGEVCRSKKRSKTTGHKSDKTRASTLRGRTATVQNRVHRLPVGALTRDEVHDHFKRTLAGSKWKVIPGWHCFRHSFISLAASRGVDQRLIDEWVGHQTEEQRKRYRHLLPSTQQDAIQSVFKS